MGDLSYLRRQIDEIASDRVLRIYGALLAASHLLTLAWWVHTDLAPVLSAASEHLCWPWLESCHRWPYPSAEAVTVLFAVYGLLSVATAGLFAARRELVTAAWGGLVLVSLLKLALMALDFRTRMNQHYMVAFVTLPFLVLPNKRVTIGLLIPFFYFWAGTLKLNPEWLSGAALYRPLWLIGPRLLPWACGYVVALELGMVWGVWGANRWVFWGALAQLVLFHGMSYPVVEFFYPALMLSLLAIYPLCRVLGGAPAAPRTWAGLKPGLALVGVFSALQLWPHLHAGDTALTGEGRLFALHMFDARIQCESHARIHREGRPDDDVNLSMPLVPRIQCDPLVYLNRAKTLCAQLAHAPGFIDLDLSLVSRRATADTWTTVVDERGFCRAPPSYALFGANPWIRH